MSDAFFQRLRGELHLKEAPATMDGYYGDVFSHLPVLETPRLLLMTAVFILKSVASSLIRPQTAVLQCILLVLLCECIRHVQTLVYSKF